MKILYNGKEVTKDQFLTVLFVRVRSKIKGEKGKVLHKKILGDNNA